MNDKTKTIIEGLLLLVFGILIAVTGIGTVVDICFGIAFCVGGISMLAFGGYAIGHKSGLSAPWLILGVTLLTIGITLFTPYLSLAALVQFIVIAILGFGIGLIIQGIIDLVRKATLLGVTRLVVGVALVTLAILYLTIPDFQKVFWIIVGILIAVYGALVFISALVKPRGRK